MPTPAPNEPLPALRPRRTLARTATVEGITLFTGVSARIDITPAAAGLGLRFLTSGTAETHAIPARVEHVVPENRRTVVALHPLHPPGPANPAVQTTEHLLSALAALGVTDALVRLTGPEIPMGDGSAAPFVEAILAAGLVDLPGPGVPPVRVLTPIILEDPAAGWRIEAHPTDEPALIAEYRLHYPPGAGLEAQSAAFTLPIAVSDAATEAYRADIAPARTFSLAAEAQAARAMGLFKHLEPRDTLVIAPTGPINNAYRFPNEPARHKLLDLIGDLALAGRPVQARVIATRTGHAHNHALARQLAALP